MGSKTRIIILQMKEIIYTVIFAALALLMIFLFVYMFFLKRILNPQKRHPHLHIPRAFTPHPLSSATTR